MVAPKEAHALSSYYKKLWTEKYGGAPIMNRHSARWAFDSMLMDMGAVEARGLLDYYFETVSTNRHSLDWFLYNYEKLQTARAARDEDREQLAVIRRETQKRAEEWRKKKIVQDRTRGS